MEVENHFGRIRGFEGIQVCGGLEFDFFSVLLGRLKLLGRDVRLFAPASNHKDLMPEDVQNMTNWSRESVNCRKDGSIFPVRSSP